MNRIRRTLTNVRPRPAHLMARADRPRQPLVRGRHLMGKAMRAVPKGESSTFCARVAERLYALREEQEIARSELAAALGIGEDQVWRLERGQSRPTLDMLYRWAAALGVRPSDLLEVDT